MVKHKDERYLVPMSNVNNGSVSAVLSAKKLNFTECVMFRTVSNDFTDEEVKTFDYDMLVFFSPAGINALTKNFPTSNRTTSRIATFGSTINGKGCNWTPDCASTSKHRRRNSRR